MKITVDVEIDGPKSRVWTAITDVDQWLSMISGIVDINVLHRPGEGFVGLKWTETRKMFGKEATETMWITESKHEEFYCTRAESHGAIYSTVLAVEEVASKTRLTMTFSATSDSVFGRIVSSIMSIFMKRLMRRMLLKDLADIRDYVEKGQPLAAKSSVD